MTSERGSSRFAGSAPSVHSSVRQQNYSHQKMQIVFLILAHWLTANLLAIGSLTLSFTRFRSGSVAIVLAIIVGAYGLLLSIAQGFPTRGIHLIHLLSWFPVLIACTSTVVWYRARAGKAELPNKAVVDNRLPAPSRYACEDHNHVGESPTSILNPFD
jgi:VanZ family protein